MLKAVSSLCLTMMVGYGAARAQSTATDPASGGPPVHIMAAQSDVDTLTLAITNNFFGIFNIFVDMFSHGGSVLSTNRTEAIFWGSEWLDPTFAGDKISGLDALFEGFGGSGYAAISAEYSDITTSSTYLGHLVDGSTAPQGELSTSGAVQEACAMTQQNPDPSAIYFIYTSTSNGGAQYCAWHSWGTCDNGMPVQVAYLPNTDTTAAEKGCDPKDTWTDHSRGLTKLANATAHELSEAITDPSGGGWRDWLGNEIGDKCAWVFQSPVVLSNGSIWKLQGEWSNNAYNKRAGFPNRVGQKGCEQGN